MNESFMVFNLSVSLEPDHTSHNDQGGEGPQDYLDPARRLLDRLGVKVSHKYQNCRFDQFSQDQHGCPTAHGHPAQASGDDGRDWETHRQLGEEQQARGVSLDTIFKALNL